MRWLVVREPTGMRRFHLLLMVLAIGVLAVSDRTCSGSSSGLATRRSSVTVIATGAGTQVTNGYLSYRTAMRDALQYRWHHQSFTPAEFGVRFSPVAIGARYNELFNSFVLGLLEGFADHDSRDRFSLNLAYLDGDRAVVEDCAGGPAVVGTDIDPRPQNRSSTRPSLTRAVLRVEGGAWKVSLVTWASEPCTLGKAQALLKLP